MQDNVASWLENLKMAEYINLFKREGYSKKSDVDSLKGLKKSDLTDMGITKRGICKQVYINYIFIMFKFCIYSY